MSCCVVNIVARLRLNLYFLFLRCKELNYPKELPQISLIFIFVNEALSVILRSVHSAVNHTPAHLLKEIILVDDNSDDEDLKAPLEEYVHKRYPGLVKVVRNEKREGLIRARVQGWKAAIAPITGFFDAHVEFSSGWTPAMIGCSFVVNRLFFGEIGLLDPGMDVYGGENIELGIKVWLCGGSMEVLPCSRVAHIERMKKPYNSDIGFYTKRNALRVAEVWMDDYKSHVYIAWNIPMDNPGIDIGDISERVLLRKHLNCKSFQWYLDNVYPEMRRFNNTVAYGEVRNNKAKDFCLDQGPSENHTAILYPCHGMVPQLVRYTREGYLYLGPLGSTVLLPDTRCLVDNRKSQFPQLVDCEKVKNIHLKSWRFVQNGSILNLETGRCLEVETGRKSDFGLELVLRQCSGQKWTIRNVLKQAG
eukprot:gi/632979768/ref/XP_007906655.1/ PREDICTED: putative polypeptide N-acetylgalactosaminyltransferase-like protein 3 isoform X2 [Callorhinchus milii]